MIEKDKKVVAVGMSGGVTQMIQTIPAEKINPYLMSSEIE